MRYIWVPRRKSFLSKKTQLHDLVFEKLHRKQHFWNNVLDKTQEEVFKYFVIIHSNMFGENLNEVFQQRNILLIGLMICCFLVCLFCFVFAARIPGCLAVIESTINSSRVKCVTNFKTVKTWHKLTIKQQ